MRHNLFSVEMVVLNSTLNKTATDFIIILCCLCNFLFVSILIVLFRGGTINRYVQQLGSRLLNINMTEFEVGLYL